MIPIPEDFHLRASVMLEDETLVNRDFKVLKSFENPQWSLHWLNLSQLYKASAQHTKSAQVQALKKQCAALAISCYPALSDNQRAANYEKLKETYRTLCEQEGYPVQYSTFHHEALNVPFIYREAALTSPKKGIIIIIRGLDSFKEVRYWNENELLANGFHIVSVDFPGMGENPVAMNKNSEEVFKSLINHLNHQLKWDLPIICWGLGFGGYWAQKMGSMETFKLAGAINQGGPIHYGFKPRISRILFHWSEIQFLSKMIFESLHQKTAVRVFISQLSLLKQGILHQPQCPILYINGDNDKTASTKEIDLLRHEKIQKKLISGAGHLAIDRLDDQVLPEILSWLKVITDSYQTKSNHQVNVDYG